MGLPFDRDPKRTCEAGWCVVFHENEDPAVKLALQPLIEFRRQQVGDDRIVKVLDFRAGESVSKWLNRFRVVPGSVDPLKVPLYVLLVGDPATIPFSFQRFLGVEYAVGRISFPSAAQYRSYADSVISSEQLRRPGVLNLTALGVTNPGDEWTKQAVPEILQPLRTLAERIRGRGTYVSASYSEACTKAELIGRLTTSNSGPEILLTVCHGLTLPPGAPAAEALQGSLIMQEWPGPSALRQPIPPAWYFSAGDIAPSSQLGNKVTIHISAYSAGTEDTDSSTGTAAMPFVSALARAMLGNPGGGSLAFIGHTDRIWQFSGIQNPMAAHIYENLAGSIALGLPVGYAVSKVGEHHAGSAMNLVTIQENVEFGLPLDTPTAIKTLTAFRDLQSLILLGDPAVQIC